MHVLGLVLTWVLDEALPLLKTLRKKEEASICSTGRFRLKALLCSRRSWVDEVEEEAARSAGRSNLFELPPLAATAHASLVLRLSSLDPEAEPFVVSPGGSDARLHFTNSEASFGGSDGPPSSDRGKGVLLPRRQCRHRRRRPRLGSFMGDARRSHPRASPLPLGDTSNPLLFLSTVFLASPGGDDTASVRSVSTSHEPSVPPVCAPPTPEAVVVEPPQDALASGADVNAFDQQAGTGLGTVEGASLDRADAPSPSANMLPAQAG
jgi:hypothetical protein